MPFASIGQLLGAGEWKTIDQPRIDSVADVTEDHQWIHVDAARAAAESPYGGSVAHGFLPLSLIPKLSKDTFRVENARMGINHGLNRVRFLAPVMTGSRTRVRSELLAADRIDTRTVNLTVRHTIEVEGSIPRVGGRLACTLRVLVAELSGPAPSWSGLGTLAGAFAAAPGISFG